MLKKIGKSILKTGSKDLAIEGGYSFRSFASWVVSYFSLSLAPPATISWYSNSKECLSAKMKVKVSLMPAKMFSFFCLEEDDFSEKGDNANFEGMKLKRGKDIKGKYWKYYQPPKGMIGVGLEVENKFDGGNKDWLASDAGGKEWAVGYHGIRWHNPQEIVGKIVKEGYKTGNA
jgi:hypothetical protein